MRRIGDLLGQYRARGFGAAVSRAMVIEEANRWLREKVPGISGAAHARAIVGSVLVCQCASGVAASEIRIASNRLLAHLRERFPQAAPAGLKCFVGGGTVDTPPPGNDFV